MKKIILLLLLAVCVSGCAKQESQQSQQELQSLYDFIEAKKEAGNYSTGN